MRTSQRALEKIRQYEGYEPIAKNCPAGIPTLGFGTTILPDGSRVELGWETDPVEAMGYFLHFVEHVCEPLVETHFGSNLNQNEWDAAASWVYNMRHDKIRAGKY